MRVREMILREHHLRAQAQLGEALRQPQILGDVAAHALVAADAAGRHRAARG
jgi:hypothetical protein